jgi:hypothetical protein
MVFIRISRRVVEVRGRDLIVGYCTIFEKFATQAELDCILIRSIVLTVDLVSAVTASGIFQTFMPSFGRFGDHIIQPHGRHPGKCPARTSFVREVVGGTRQDRLAEVG